MIIIHIMTIFTIIACAHIHIENEALEDVGYIPLRLPLSRWAKLWLTLVAAASCNNAEAGQSLIGGKEEE
jgi:hypothetical protein